MLILAVVYENIQKYYKDLTYSEQLAIDFILDYPDLKELKLKVIEKELFISAPTVIRAIKKLQFPSFTAFKYAVINSKEETVEKSNVTTLNTFSNIMDTIRNDFLMTLNMVEEASVNKIVDAIINSRRVFCVGIGSSASVANSFTQKLKNYGIWANDYSDSFPIRDIPELAKPRDCIIVFSLSGAEEPIIKLLAQSKVSGATIISVTGFGVNPVSELSDITFMTHQSVPKRNRLRSRLMLFVASEIIFETLIARNELQKGQ